MRDQRTFIERVSAHAGALRRFAHRLTRNPADAEDVLQDTLVKAWREALWLREVEELSYEEIAAVVACPLGTVRSRLARARAALAARLGKGAGHGV
ncbi:MAG: hypothetical protein EHM78_12700 [Myxococcaceae bacterium]|nr:MAG: hypothetical protein EHM78_12700 [Myxococcaceae bacterium]